MTRAKKLALLRKSQRTKKNKLLSATNKAFNATFITRSFAISAFKNLTLYFGANFLYFYESGVKISAFFQRIYKKNKV